MCCWHDRNLALRPLWQGSGGKEPVLTILWQRCSLFELVPSKACTMIVHIFVPHPQPTLPTGMRWGLSLYGSGS